MAVYFIQNSRTNSIKIGTAIRPLDRIRDLQTACEDKLNICHIEDSWGQEDEHRMHRLFVADRIMGEWFRNSEALVHKIHQLQSVAKAKEAILPEVDALRERLALLESQNDAIQAKLKGALERLDTLISFAMPDVALQCLNARSPNVQLAMEASGWVDQ